MGLIPSLNTISGTISAAPLNANYSRIFDAVNTYCAFVDQSATISGAWTFSTSPTITNALTVGTGLTVTAGGITVTAGASTFGAAVSITGTCTATTFSGSGASLTSIPQSAVTSLVSDLAGKAASSHTHTLSDLSGAVTSSQLPANITGRTSVSAEQFKGVTNAGNIIDLQNSATNFLSIVSGAGWSVGNNSTATTPSTVGPTGKTTHAAADKFLVVDDNGTSYYLRLERWT